MFDLLYDSNRRYECGEISREELDEVLKRSGKELKRNEEALRLFNKALNEPDKRDAIAAELERKVAEWDADPL